ncbi:ATPdependent RNA helicase [Allomyces javanicus]|nr:ATPdependent RNA helicase [Allomyces javanicus]
MGALSKLFDIPLRVAAALYTMLATLLPFLPQFRKAHTLLPGSLADYDRLVARYEATYSGDHPDFYRGSYKDLIQDVKQKLQLAVVYLHSDDHDDTVRFCRETLADPDVRGFFQQERINFYYGPVHLAEAYEVASLLGATGYPCLALITLTSVSGVTKPAVVHRIEGFVTADVLVRQLRDAAQTHGLFMATVRHEREQRDAERQMRAMQDQAYEESLRRDQERQREAERAREEALRAAELAAAQLDAKRTALRLRQSTRASRRASLPAEPTTDRALVQIQLPDGRVRRAFRASDPVRAVYEYVDTLDPLGEDEIEDVDGEWEEPENGFGFMLVAMYPRRELTEMDVSIDEAGLKGASLAVEID